MTRKRQGDTRAGQAVVEMAIVLPLMLIMTFGFLGVMVWMETVTELQAGTALATTTAATFADDSDAARTASDDTFLGTMRQYHYVDLGPLVCRHVGPGTRVECTATATLRFDRTPLALAWFVNVPMRASAVSYSSAFRSP